jgi:hypothetical protein
MTNDTKSKDGFENFWGKAKEMAYPLFVDTGDKWAAACGLTKLEVFTMAAMQGILANPAAVEMNLERVNVEAINQAEDMLKALANRAALEKAND